MLQRLKVQIFTFLFYLLKTIFVAYQKINYIVQTLGTLFYNRQSRIKLFEILKIDEQEIAKRISLLQKIPPQIIIGLQILNIENKNEVEKKIKKIIEIIGWTLRNTQIQSIIIYFFTENQNMIIQQTQSILKQKYQSQLNEYAKSKFSISWSHKQLKVQISAFTKFYQNFCRQISQLRPLQCSKYKSPMIIIFNKMKGLLGVPYIYLKSGQIQFKNDVDRYNLVDFQQSLKYYNNTKQRGGK